MVSESLTGEFSDMRALADVLDGVGEAVGDARAAFPADPPRDWDLGPFGAHVFGPALTEANARLRDLLAGTERELAAACEADGDAVACFSAAEADHLVAMRELAEPASG